MNSKLSSFIGSGNVNTLDGYVIRNDPRGWLELTMFRFDTPAPVEQNVLVYLFDLHASDRMCFNDTSLLNTFVVISGVYPIHLWNSLAGFTTGIGSTITQSSHMRLKRTRSSDKFPPCGGISCCDDLCKNKCIVFLLWQAVASGRIYSSFAPVSTGNSMRISPPMEATLKKILLSVAPLDLTPFEISLDIGRKAVETLSDFAFYIIRASNDIDWLCSMLPEILNTRHVLKLALKLCKKKKRYLYTGVSASSSTSNKNKRREYRSYVGLCGRDNKSIGLSFTACVVGSIVSMDLDVGMIVLSDGTGAEVTAYVDGDLRRVLLGTISDTLSSCCRENTIHPPESVLLSGLIAVIAQPCLLVQEEVSSGTPLSVVLTVNVSRVRLIRCNSTNSIFDPVDENPNNNLVLDEPKQKLCRISNHEAASVAIISSSEHRAAKSDPCVLMSVRRALTVNPNEVAWWTTDVTGIVICKETIESFDRVGDTTAASLNNSSMPQPLWGGMKKCLIVIRDMRYADKITAYVESSCISRIPVGSIIYIRKCTIRTNKSKKNVYIDFDRKRGSRIGMYQFVITFNVVYVVL